MNTQLQKPNDLTAARAESAKRRTPPLWQRLRDARRYQAKFESLVLASAGQLNCETDA